MFCCTLLYVHSSIAIILMGKSELVALLNLSSWCLVMVERLLLAVPRGCLWFVIVVFPDHTHLLFLVEFFDLAISHWVVWGGPGLLDYPERAQLLNNLRFKALSFVTMQPSWETIMYKEGVK